MVLPISGFLPVPLPMMIPFMGAQSLVLGKMFGEGFQYGKRKISAMSNDDFNKLTFNDMMSNARHEITAAIPEMQAAIQDMLPLVETIVAEFAKYLKTVIAAAPSEIGGITNVAAHAVFPHEAAEEGALSALFPEQFKTILSETDVGSDKGPKRVPKPGDKTDLTDRWADTDLIPYKGIWYTQKRLQQLITAQSAAAERLLQRKVEPAPHIIDRSRSNVSLQSLRIEKSKLEANLKNAIRVFDQVRRNKGAFRYALKVEQQVKNVARHRQNLANFKKMHGARF